jgi:hypothetical protein
VVKTSKEIRGAGTDANVYVELRGEAGATTGRHVLKNSNFNNFERGQADVFEVTAGSVGTPTSLLIGHDGKGLGAAWHLEQVRVQCAPTGSVHVPLIPM